MPILLCLWSTKLPIYYAYVNLPMLDCLCYNAYVIMPMLQCLCFALHHLVWSSCFQYKNNIIIYQTYTTKLYSRLFNRTIDILVYINH